MSEQGTWNRNKSESCHVPGSLFLVPHLGQIDDKVFDSFAGAVADIPDGASIFISGFTEPGTPHNLLRALWEQGRRT